MIWKLAFHKVACPVGQPSRHIFEIYLSAGTDWSPKIVRWVLGYTTADVLLDSEYVSGWLQNQHYCDDFLKIEFLYNALP